MPAAHPDTPLAVDSPGAGSRGPALQGRVGNGQTEYKESYHLAKTGYEYLEDWFELDHARVDEGEARVVVGEDGGGGHHCVRQRGGPAEIVQELATDLRTTLNQEILNIWPQL